MVFTTEGFFERWPEWDLNPRSMNFVQTLWPTELSGHEFNSHSELTLYSYSNFIVCSVSHFILAIAFISRHVCFHVCLRRCTAYLNILMLMLDIFTKTCHINRALQLTTRTTVSEIYFRYNQSCFCSAAELIRFHWFWCWCWHR